MTLQEAINRGSNLAVTAIVAISGIAFFPEFFTEDEWYHKLDEGVLLLLAIGAIAWYLIGKNKYSRTIVPTLFAAAALIMKIVALAALEAGDPADLGDEFGAVILFAITVGFAIWQFVSMRRLEATSAAEARTETATVR